MIASISIERFRGFEHLEIPNLPRVNLIGGVNNSGKTALLEAIYLGLERKGDRLNKLPRLFRPQSGVNDDRYYWRWLSFEGGTGETRIALQITGVGLYEVLWAAQEHKAINGEILTNHAGRRLVATSLNPEQKAAWPNVEVFIPAPTLPVEDAQVYIRAAKKAPEGEERIEALLREIEPRLKPIRAFPDDQTNQPLIHIGLMRRSYHFVVAGWRGKTAESRRVKYCGTLILAVLFASLALSEDFKTTNGKVYKDATVSRIEADGIELKTKTGISKVYFTELPQEVQERFHWAKPEAPREPFYRRWAAAAEDPAVLAKIIAAGASISATVGLVVNYIRSRRQPTMRATRASRRRAVHRTRS